MPIYGEGEKVSEIPIPLANYVHLIRNHASPYYEIGAFLMQDMATRYHEFGNSSGIIYAINPRIVHEEIRKNMKSEKLTTVNVCRTILALLYGAKLNEKRDFFVTTTSGGRRNYHVNVNSRTLNLMAAMF